MEVDATGFLALSPPNLLYLLYPYGACSFKRHRITFSSTIWKSQMSASSPTTGAQTITRAVRALKLIAEQPNGLRLTDLAEGLELTQPTAHRLLQTLMSERM